MPEVSACPDASRYAQMASGQASPEEKGTLLHHLEGCDACAARVEALPEQDPLVELLRQARRHAGAASGDSVDRLVARLSKQHPAETAAPDEGQTLPPTPPAPLLPFVCPACGKKLKVKESAAGKKIKCPACQHAVSVLPKPAMLPAPEAPTLAPASRIDARPPEGTNPGGGVPACRPDAKDRELYDFLAPPQAPDELGQLGHYRVLKVLGAGGMGVVFQADEPNLKRRVALKAMLPTLAVSESARQRFLREAQAAAAIEHDHIVPIFYVGEDRGVPFIAMPFLQGEPLDERLRREGRLPLAEVLRIGREMAEGLAVAHERGLIHRDIKPANVWLESRPSPLSPRGRGVGGEGGRVKILDFGLARAAGGESHLTQTGAIVGTPAYMAPEQARGEAVDGRCDLFSLGCVLYRMATGKAPFRGRDTISTLMVVATETPPAPRSLNPGVAPALETLIVRLLAKEPGGRPADAREVVEALAALEHDPTATSPAGPGAPPAAAKPTRPSRRLLLAGGAAVLLVGLLAAAVVFSLRTREGTLEVTVSEPGVQVFIDGEEKVVLTSKKTGRIELIPGAHRLTVKRGDEELYMEAFTLKSGGEKVIDARWTPKQAAGPKPAVDEAWFKQVAAMKAEDQITAVVAKLKERNADFDGKVTHKIEQAEVVELGMSGRIKDLSPVRALTELRVLTCSDAPVSDLSPLKGMKLTVLCCWGTPVSDLSPLKDMKLTDMDLNGTQVSDLSPLKDMKLTVLWCGSTKVSDLSPLKDMKLKFLSCWGTPVSDLSPLKDMKLTELNCGVTKVVDLSPLKGMKLTFLHCDLTPVSDLSPLKGMPLKELRCDFKPERDAEVLRSLKTLEKINDKPAADFWKEVDAGASSKKP